MMFHPYDRAQRPRCDEFDLVRLDEIPVLFLEIRIAVPGIPLLRLIHERLQQVPASRVFWPSWVVFGRREGFRAAALVEQSSCAPALWVGAHAEELVVQRVA